MDHMIVKNLNRYQVVKQQHIEEARGKSTHKRSERLLTKIGMLAKSEEAGSGLVSESFAMWEEQIDDSSPMVNISLDKPTHCSI